MKKQSFIMGAVILTIGGIIAKIIGAFYKIPLTNILGSNGMGIYYLVFPLYSIMLVLASNGFSLALSKCVAHERVNKNKRNETTYFQMAVFLSFTVSFLCALAILIFCRDFATLQQNSNAILGYIAIAPALVCASLVGVIKGYFQGIENMIPSSIAMIFEQIVKLVIGLILSGAWLYRGVEYAVLGAICGVTISELITLFIMVFNYIWYKKKEDYKFFMRDSEGRIKTIDFNEKIIVRKIYKKYYPKRRKHFRQKLTIQYFYTNKDYVSKRVAVKKLIAFSLPTTLSSLILPLVSLVDSFVVINILEKSGVSSMLATSLYGLSNGVVSSLISLPVIFTVAFSTAVMPNISALVSQHNREELSERSSFFIKITWIISLLLFVGFIVFSSDIIGILYGKGLSGRVLDEFAYSNRLLIVASSTIIYNCLLSTLIALLNGLGKPTIPTIALIVAMIVRFAISYTLILVPQINIFAVYISNSIFMALACLICTAKLRNYLDLSLAFGRSVVLPLIIAGASAGVGYVVKGLLRDINTYVNVFISALIVIIVYLSGILLLKVFTRQEKKYFPKLPLQKFLRPSKK